MIIIRSLSQLRSFLKRHNDLRCKVGYCFSKRPGFYFTMLKDSYEEQCNYGDHKWVLLHSEDIYRVMFVPKADKTLSKSYLMYAALNLCAPEKYCDKLPF